MNEKEIIDLSSDVGIKGYRVDHLGIVASTINQLGISEKIDKLIPLKGNSKTTIGQRVSALILNGLGFTNNRLYLFPEYLSNKPVDLLLGSNNLKAELFNDDSLGRCLDKIHKYGTSKLFSELALPIAIEFGIPLNKANLDTTSISLYGQYNDNGVKQCDVVELNKNKSETDLNKIHERNINLNNDAVPAFGHAKNKRSDLKQMTLLMATNGSNGLPLWMESHSGNASDQKTLEEAAQRMKKFCSTLEDIPSLMFVGDSAMYANCVKNGDDLSWISRVPEKINLAKDMISKDNINWTELENGYKMFVQHVTYGNVEQRWVLIYSQQAYDKEIITLEKNIAQEFDEITKLLKHLKNKEYGCEAEVNNEIKKINKTLKYHIIQYTINEEYKYNGVGRPSKEDTPTKKIYKVSPLVEQNNEAISKAKSQKGKFIIATNQLDASIIADDKLLSTYKEQSGTESGFKFIKNNSFEVDSVFLKKPERIDALLMIMVLCLMVYSYSQYFLRKNLEENNETIPSQVNKSTKRPSMKWIYQLLDGVIILNITINNKLRHIVLNLNDTLRKIIRYFGVFACKIYGI